MPDANNVPQAADVSAKLSTVIDISTLTTAQTADIPNIISAVVAEFQSPTSPGGTGGTGRTFVQVSETKTFDGTGNYELQIPDVVPNSSLTVTVDTTPITDCVLKTNYHALGTNTLCRPTNVLYNFDTIYGFTRGIQNVAVTTVWGYAASLPQDIYEAILVETGARVLINTQGGIEGLGAEYKSETTEYKATSSNPEFSIATSAITTWRKQFRDCINRYRDRGEYKLKNLVGRMV